MGVCFDLKEINITKKQQLIIILGAPRSGVGLLKKMLNSLGLNTPKQVESGGSEFDETDSIIKAFFDDIGFNPYLPGQLLHSWQESEAAKSAKRRIKELLKEMTKNSSPSVLANPTTCRVMPLWLDVIEELGIEPKFIHIIRHPWEVAKALCQTMLVDLDDGFKIWLNYYLAALNTCTNNEHIAISYDKFLKDPLDTVTLISKRFGISYPVDTHDFYSKISMIVQPKVISRAWVEGVPSGLRPGVLSLLVVGKWPNQGLYLEWFLSYSLEFQDTYYDYLNKQGKYSFLSCFFWFRLATVYYHR